MSLEELRKERTRCSVMKSAIDSLVSALGSFSKSFNNCSAHFNAGGLMVDGVPADTYAFGGFNKYVEAKITPLINQLAGLSSALASAIQQLDAEIKRLEEEARRAAALAAEAKRNELNLANAKNVGDKGFARDTKNTSKDNGIAKETKNTSKDDGIVRKTK